MGRATVCMCLRTRETLRKPTDLVKESRETVRCVGTVLLGVSMGRIRGVECGGRVGAGGWRGGSLLMSMTV